MDRRAAPRRRLSRRRGLTTPLVVAALLVAMLGIALILDRLWLSSARLELTTAAEAAALAAGRQLITDERLVDVEITPQQLELARQAAEQIASQNFVAGSPVQLNLNGGDVRFLKLQPTEDGRPAEFVETDTRPTHVLVSTSRTRFNGNPVALFMAQLTRQPWGDVFSEVVAHVDNHVVGVRPFVDVPAPALPLAIWKQDPAGLRKDTWQYAIDQRRGADHYGYDDESRQVLNAPDGIPELTLRTMRPGGKAQDSNVHLVDLGTDLQPTLVAQQMLIGWTRQSLEDRNGELSLGSLAGDLTVSLTSAPRLPDEARSALEEIVGEPRIALLYDQFTSTGKDRYQARLVELVAIRVLDVADQSDGSCYITVQPTVLASRTVLTTNAGPADGGNLYLYRLDLMH